MSARNGCEASVVGLSNTIRSMLVGKRQFSIAKSNVLRPGGALRWCERLRGLSNESTASYRDDGEDDQAGRELDDGHAVTA